jgi:thiol-disulfide isomerase/thioredoxin
VLLMTAVGCGAGDGLPSSTAAAGDQGRLWTQYPDTERQELPPVEGTTAAGDEVDVQALRPAVVVLNTWFAGCAPCRREAPVLQAASEQYTDKGVRVVGIDVRDTSASVVTNFQERNGVTYPSIVDADGQASLALRGFAPSATPVTLVLDPQGRVAARVAGEVGSSVLDGLIDDVLAEAATSSPTPPTPTAG